MKKLFCLCLALLCLLSLTACREVFDEPADEKPVIYLYPTEETDVRVTLDYDGVLTAAYPAYDGGWCVTARPDGTLTDASGRSTTACSGRAREARSTTSPSASAWREVTPPPFWKMLCVSWV